MLPILPKTEGEVLKCKNTELQAIEQYFFCVMLLSFVFRYCTLHFVTIFLILVTEIPDSVLII